MTTHKAQGAHQAKKRATKQRHSPSPPDELFPPPPDVPGGDELISLLESIAQDTAAPPAARTAAVRSILEAQGRLGRHQAPPGDEGAGRPLSDATRPELEAELSRLRRHFAAQAGGNT